MSLLYLLCTYTPPPTLRCERFDERFNGFCDRDGVCRTFSELGRSWYISL